MDRYQRTLLNIVLGLGVLWLGFRLALEVKADAAELVRTYRGLVGCIIEPTLLLALALYMFGVGVSKVRDGFR